ncbi:MAG: hypothetical protein ETSY1_11600 [Candidatus Entotheonella factor]|uniref:Uncharacterized protein n=1 Tax=Entotheonella factor TaxID=1429438 RepID=W4LRK1_ENTF1|nr:MAG: hypothetical protein ETSY1_11600 [Candidatus Entotheonella factor]
MMQARSKANLTGILGGTLGLIVVLASAALAQPFTGRLMILDTANHQVHVFDLESEGVVETFAITQSMAPGFGTLLARTSNGRLGLVAQRSGHFSPENDPSVNVIALVDSGLTVEDHGDHFDALRQTPRQLPYRMGHGGGQFGLYRPIHIDAHHGLIAIHYDGSRHPDDDAQNINAQVLAYSEADLVSRTQPIPLFDLDAGSHQHGAAIAFNEDLFVVSVGTPDASLGGLDYSTLPRGAATFNAAGEEQQDFRGRCPQLHGSAITGAFVAFGCNEGPRNMADPDYTGPPITARSGVLVLTHDGGSPGAFTAAEVTYPEDGSDTTSGTLRSGTGPSEGIIIASYGPMQFLKIIGAQVQDGTPNGSSLIDVAGTIETHDIEHADDNFPQGQGRFIVLTEAGDLHIFDLTRMAGEELVTTVPGVVADVSGGCPDAGCPQLALAPGAAYLSEPALGMVHEVDLNNAVVTRQFDFSSLGAIPASLEVFGWFGLEAPLVFE